MRRQEMRLAEATNREFSTAMAKPAKMPLPVLLALTLAPALLIGITLWFVNDMVPLCKVNETGRLTSPDDQFDLVTFSRDCGDTPPNIQATLVPPGEEVPFDAASFVSVAAAADLAPGWTEVGSIVISLPEDAEVLRQDDAVAGIAITYR